MTFFSQLIKDYLIDIFTKAKNSSEAKDASFANQALQRAGYGRNQSLSTEKHSLIETLISDIRQIDDNKKDELVREVTVKKLADFKVNLIKAMRTYKASNGGETGEAYEHAEKGLRNIFKACVELKLLNKTYDKTDPFDILQYYLTLYVAKRVDKVDPLPLEKIKIVKEGLNDIREQLKVYNRDSADYELAYVSLINKSIDRMLSENQKACEEHGFKFSFSVPFVSRVISIGPSISADPSTGELEKLLSQAKRKISLLSAPAKKPEGMAKPADAVADEAAEIDAFFEPGQDTQGSGMHGNAGGGAFDASPSSRKRAEGRFEEEKYPLEAKEAAAAPASSESHLSRAEGAGSSFDFFAYKQPPSPKNLAEEDRHSSRSSLSGWIGRETAERDSAVDSFFGKAMMRRDSTHSPQPASDKTSSRELADDSALARSDSRASLSSGM